MNKKVVDKFMEKHENIEFSAAAERAIEKIDPEKNPERRVFLKLIGAGVAGLVVGAIGGFLAAPPRVEEKVIVETVTVTPTPVKKPVPTTPIKLGHLNAFTGPGAVLGESSTLTLRYLVKETNDKGGILGRKIVMIEREQGAKTDECVKEMRKLALEEKVEVSIGTIGSGMAIASAPVANELGLLHFYPANRTSALLESLNATGSTTFRTCRWDAGEAIGAGWAVMRLWPDAKKFAYIQPDYAYGRDIHMLTKFFWEKFLPGFEIVYEGWPPLYSPDFTPHITAAIESKPDVLYTSLWGGDWVTFVKQAKAYGLFEKIPHIVSGAGQESFHGPGTDAPEGVLAGVRYWWLYPSHTQWDTGREFVKGYYAMHKRYPYYTGEAAYTGFMAYKNAVEYLYETKGSWPDVDDLVETIEGMWIAAPGGWVQLRKDHELLADDVWGITKYTMELVDKYPGAGVDFPILDPVFVSVAEEIIPPVGMFLKDWLAKW